MWVRILPRVPQLLRRFAFTVMGILVAAWLGSVFSAVVIAWLLWSQGAEDANLQGYPAFGQLLISTVAASVALLVACQRLWEWYATYVVCSLEISSLQGRTVAELALENRSAFRRRVHWACLVISPHGKRFLELIAQHLSLCLPFTNDILKLQDVPMCKLNGEAAIQSGFVVLPLPFFYCEQVGIRDEKITYAADLNYKLPAGLYDVRFFVFPEPSSASRFGLHRCIHRVCYFQE